MKALLTQRDEMFLEWQHTFAAKENKPNMKSKSIPGIIFLREQRNAENK